MQLFRLEDVVGGLERLGALANRYGLETIGFVLAVDCAGDSLTSVAPIPAHLCEYSIKTGKRGRPQRNPLIQELILIRWWRWRELNSSREVPAKTLIQQALEDVKLIIPKEHRLNFDIPHIRNLGSKQKALAFLLGYK